MQNHEPHEGTAANPAATPAANEAPGLAAKLADLAERALDRALADPAPHRVYAAVNALQELDRRCGRSACHGCARAAFAHCEVHGVELHEHHEHWHVAANAVKPARKA